MKKIYMLAVLVIAFTACTQDPQIIQLPTTTDTSAAVTDAAATAGDADAATRAAAIPALTQICDDDYGFYAGDCHSMCLDIESYLYGMYSKGCWMKYNDTESPFCIWHNYIYNNDYFDHYIMARSACMDINGMTYFITPVNQLIKVNADLYAPSPNLNNLTASFPSGVVFLSLTAADNGNVFVTTGSGGEYGDTFQTQTVYRIAANGNVTEIATINAPVAATILVNWFTPYHFEYPSMLSKAKGTVLYGLDADGDIYKVSTTNGTVEYFTPRVPIKCLGAALNGNNPYAISGNTIVEVRPTLAKDIVIGTIPAEIAAAAYTLLVNADATAFYVGVKYESGWDASVYKFTVE